MTLVRFLALVAVIGLCVSPSWGVTVNFYGTSADEDIPLAGVAEINVSSSASFDELEIVVSNTSPVQTDPGICNPLLTGFGFWFGPGGMDNTDVLGWGAMTILDPMVVSSFYTLNAGTGLGSGLNYFTIGLSGNDNDGRIGNLAAAGQEFDIPETDIIFDLVVFTFQFPLGSLDGFDVNFFTGTDPVNIALRFQSIGEGGNDSGTAVPDGDGNGPVVPEPGTVALLGFGILALAAARRKRSE